MMNKIVCLLLLCCLCTVVAKGQVECPADFKRLLQGAQIDFFEPVEGAYKGIALPRHHFQPCDFAIRSRKEQLEIRYLIVPFQNEASNPVAQAPHVHCMRLVSHLASNDEQAVITILSIDEAELRETFNADWGKLFFFQPKPGFSERSHCKLLALHAEGKGTALVFFLFDQPSKELDNRHVALRFLDDVGAY